eukprot:6198794-Pleurochrysis_carterae.AAC.1
MLRFFARPASRVTWNSAQCIVCEEVSAISGESLRQRAGGARVRDAWPVRVRALASASSA